MKRVAAGIIVCNNKILIAQRKRGKDLEYFWEFPGGKIEPGETSYDYSFGTFVLEVYFAACPDPEIPELFEHEQARWVDVEDLPEYNFSPADLPVVEELLKLDDLETRLF